MLSSCSWEPLMPNSTPRQKGATDNSLPRAPKSLSTAQRSCSVSQRVCPSREPFTLCASSCQCPCPQFSGDDLSRLTGKIEGRCSRGSLPSSQHLLPHSAPSLPPLHLGCPPPRHAPRLPLTAVPWLGSSARGWTHTNSTPPYFVLGFCVRFEAAGVG